MSKEKEKSDQKQRDLWDYIQIIGWPVIALVIGTVFQLWSNSNQQARDNEKYQRELVDGYIKSLQELILDNVYAGGKDPKIELVDIEFLLRSKTTTTILALKDNETQRGLLLGFLREKNIGFMPRLTDYRHPLLEKMVKQVYCPKDFHYFPINEQEERRKNADKELKRLKQQYIKEVFLPQVQDQITQKKAFPNEEKPRDLKQELDEKLKFRIGFLTILCGIDLNNSTLSANDLSLSILGDADFTDAKLIGTNFTASRMNGAKFIKADLSEASLVDAELREALFLGTTLKKANFTKADLRGANLSSIKYKDSKGDDQEQTTDLTEANLMGANLTGANLTGANLTGVKLDPFYYAHQERLRKVDFTNANLTKVLGITKRNLKDSILCNTTMFDGKKIENRDCNKNK